LFPTEICERLKKNVPEFEELAAMEAGFSFRPVTARRDSSGEAPRSVMGEFVSGNYFRTFGLQPATGRLFGDEDDQEGAPMVGVMSYQTWKNRYGGDPSLLGRTFWINTKAVTIVGIAPKGFFGDRLSSTPPDFYLPRETMPVLLNRTMEQRFHSLPGVANVGISTYTPMEDNNWSVGIQVAGQQDSNKGAYVKVNAEYFDSVGTRAVTGRGIDPQDTATSPSVAVVNETFVKNFIPKGENPIGRRFGSPGPESTDDLQIVGVVEDTAYTTVRWKDHNMFFIPMMQRPASDKTPFEQDTSLYAGALVIQTQRPVNNMEELARETLSEINPNLAVVKFQTFDQQIADRFNGLAASGHRALRRDVLHCCAPHFGNRHPHGARRAALGCDRPRDAWRVDPNVGLAIGVPAILLCARFVESLLFEVKALAVWSRSRFSPWLPPRLSPAFFRRVARLRPIRRRPCAPNNAYADRVASIAAGRDCNAGFPDGGPLSSRKHSGNQANRENQPNPDGAGDKKLARLLDVLRPHFVAVADRVAPFGGTRTRVSAVCHDGLPRSHDGECIDTGDTARRDRSREKAMSPMPSSVGRSSPGIQRAAGLEERLETGKDAWPTVGDSGQHVRAGLEFVMGHGEPHHVTDGFDVDGYAGVLGFVGSLRGIGPGHDQTARRSAFDDFADDVDGVRLVEAAMLPLGAGLPVGGVLVSPVFASHFAAEPSTPCPVWNRCK
jgi:hypothetical protein